MIKFRPTAWFTLSVIACHALSTGFECRAGNRVQRSIVDFGAVGDGRTLNTASIQRAIDAAVGLGGGTVLVPPGVFLSGSITLKTGVELQVEKGGVVLGSANPFDYTRASGHPGLIIAANATNISITGGGCIDGQGLQLALTIDSLYHLGQFDDPGYSHDRMRPSEDVRPHLLSFDSCSNVVVRTVTVRNGAGWVQVFTRCNRVVIDSIAVESTAYWNNDGMDICDCRNVTITHCMVNAADDGICLKSMSPALCNDSISISHCTIRSSASAVKFGTDSRGGFKNITISDITVFDTYRSAIAVECVDGGIVDNLHIHDVHARNTGNAIFMRLGQRNRDGRVGVLRNVTVDNVHADISFGRPDIQYDLRGPDLPFMHNPFPASITGIPGAVVQNVALKNIVITYPGRGTKGMAYAPLTRLDKIPEAEGSYPEFSMFGELPAWGLYARHVDGLTIQGMNLRVLAGDYRPACVFDDVEHVSVDTTEIQTPDHQREIVLRNVRNGTFHNVKINGQNEHGMLQLGTCALIKEE